VRGEGFSTFSGFRQDGTHAISRAREGAQGAVHRFRGQAQRKFPSRQVSNSFAPPVSIKFEKGSPAAGAPSRAERYPHTTERALSGARQLTLAGADEIEPRSKHVDARGLRDSMFAEGAID